jgi:hypothetical protein
VEIGRDERRSRESVPLVGHLEGYVEVICASTLTSGALSQWFLVSTTVENRPLGNG